MAALQHFEDNVFLSSTSTDGPKYRKILHIAIENEHLKLLMIAGSMTDWMEMISMLSAYRLVDVLESLNANALPSILRPRGNLLQSLSNVHNYFF